MSMKIYRAWAPGPRLARPAPATISLRRKERNKDGNFMKNKTLTITAALLWLAGGVYAGEAAGPSPSPRDRDIKYLTVDGNSVTLEEVKLDGGIPLSTGTPVLPPYIQNNTGPLGDINNAVTTLDNIVNLVDKVFTIIAKNQPVVNTSINYASAVPYGITHWGQLQGWSKPATKRYGFKINNLMSLEVVKLVFQVHWTYNGNVKGVGKFLTGVTVEPLSINTAWGYNVDLTAEVPDSTIANVGTHENPVASMQLKLHWKIHTSIQDTQYTDIFYLQGDGPMEELGIPYRNGLKLANQKEMDAVTERLSNVKFN